MKSVIQGTAVTSGQAPTFHLGTLRRSILRLIVGNPLFTAQEQLLASHNIHECEDGAKLALWLKNVRRVFTEREVVLEQTDLAEVMAQPVRYATAEQTSEVHKLALHRTITVGERTKALLALPRLDYGAATALIGELWAKVLHRTEAQAATSFLPSTPAPAPRPLPASPPPVVPPTAPQPTCPAPFTDSSACQAA
jgi:hypothetical protein